MTQKVLVSKALVDLLEEMANDVMQDPVHERDWRDENQTSKTSRAKGGVIEIATDHDWKLAFAIWYFGERKIAQKLPRER